MSDDRSPQQDTRTRQAGQADEALRRVQQDPSASPAHQVHAERVMRALRGI